MNRLLKESWLVLALSGAMLATAALVGCEKKEKLLDIETPGADIELERSTDNGRVDVDVDVDDE